MKSIEMIQFDSNKFFTRLRGISHNLSIFLQLSFSNQGFVAGGFARFLAQIQDDVDDVWLFKIAKYFGDAEGDIDIFFPSLQSRANFINDLKRTQIFDRDVTNIDKSDFATTLLLRTLRQDKINSCGDSAYNVNIKLQLVKCVYDEPQQIIEQFDMYNSMFWFNDKVAFGSKHAVALEQQKLIDVANYTAPSLPGRIAKYMMKYDYHGITAQSHDQLISWASQVYEWLKTSNDEYHVRAFSSRIKRLAKEVTIFSDEDIIFLARIIKSGFDIDEEDYTHLVRVNAPALILKRINKSCKRVNWDSPNVFPSTALKSP